MQKLTAELEAELNDGKLEMHLEPRGLVVSLREATFFPSGTDEVDAKSYPVIDKVAGVIVKLPNPISFEGHTDSVPIHTARFRSNWDLSAARSIALLEVFRSRYHCDITRFTVVGHADTMPLAPNDTAEGRARNRRVDVVIRNMTLSKNSPVDTRPSAAVPAK
jgi:chemotaxis protein MotB